jgi:hypothetical protein
MGTAGCFPGLKQWRSEADHSATTSDEAKKTWIYITTPPFRDFTSLPSLFTKVNTDKRLEDKDPDLNVCKGNS